jgi:hypothetical protein
VFTRDQGDRRRIGSEMARLRNELASVREHLRVVEFNLKGATARKALKVLKQWEAAIKELEKTFGPSPFAANNEGILNTLPDAAELAGEPQNPVKWVTVLSKAPFKLVSQVLARHRLVELHKVAKGAPGPQLLSESVRELFGSIRD